MIKGKYLRERKAIRVKRRAKLIIALVIITILYKILMASFSLYESEANSEAEIDVAFYVLDDTYQTRTISLPEMLPGQTQYVKFSVANFYKDENNQDVICDTDMECELKARTTTNLPFEYTLYIDQDLTSQNLDDKLVASTDGTWDSYGTIFKYLVNEDGTPEEQANGVTDNLEFSYNSATSHTYIIGVTFPAGYSDYEYQNIIDCIEISIDSHQVVD